MFAYLHHLMNAVLHVARQRRRDSVRESGYVQGFRDILCSMSQRVERGTDLGRTRMESGLYKPETWPGDALAFCLLILSEIVVCVRSLLWQKGWW